METVLLLNSIFALAARFSDKPYWEQLPTKRGVPFADQARSVHDRLIRAAHAPSLRFLQGCILLTFHDLASKPSFQTWLGVSTCCRIAYSLSLHQIDKKSLMHEDQTPQRWAKKEEERRAWWALYQMDNFASIIASRPFNIDANRMNVMLPAADLDWFKYSPSPSVSLSARGLGWQTVADREIRNPYAWYLVSNIMLRATHQEFNESDCSPEEVKILEASLHCLGLTLPSIFRDIHECYTTDDHDFTDKNWAICALILVQS